MPFSIVTISALLWIQGVIWAALGVLALLYYPQTWPGGDLLMAVLFGFTALSLALAVLLLRPGGELTRDWVIAQECFMTFLGVAVLCAIGLLVPLLFEVGVFALFGSFLAACAVAGLFSAPAREYCRSRAVVQ